MFLDLLRRRNPRLIQTAVELHQAGQLPANCYVLDLDAVGRNATAMRAEADRLGLKVWAMTKQVGRNPDFCRAVANAGITAAVAVDMQDARAVRDAGLRIGNLGHLVQIPSGEAAAAARMQPEFWTVFNSVKAAEAAAASQQAGREQPLLARIHAPGDRFYPGHEGGFSAADILDVAHQLDRLEGARFTGVTTFPALLQDPSSGQVKPTPNLRTLTDAAAKLKGNGYADVEVNAPGTTSTHVFGLLADAGASQVEPGHGLTGTTPAHAVTDLVEDPAVIYLTEVSHLHADRAYCFGGGLYIDPVLGHRPPTHALISREPTTDAANLVYVDIPPPEAIDYYAMADVSARQDVQPGDSVVFGFRIQAFVTRAYTAGVADIGTGNPRVAGIWSADGTAAQWP